MGVMEHDALNKLVFALPPVGADALRIVARDWVNLLDLETLERVSTEHPSTDLTQRIGDCRDPSAGAMEDWPADNRVTAWVRLLRCTSAAALHVALGQCLSESPDPGDAGFREVLRLWSLALRRANKAWSGEELAEFEDSQGENEMASPTSTTQPPIWLI